MEDKDKVKQLKLSGIYLSQNQLFDVHTTKIFSNTMMVPEKSSSTFDFNSQILEDWKGGYKLEIDLRAKSYVEGWEVDFSLPYAIREVYGADLIDRGEGNYTISGQNDQVDLQRGQSISPLFIIADDGKQALLPKFISSDSKIPTNIKPQINNKQKIIHVDRDFDGNLESAIAAAKDGDVVKLGKKTYYTSGIILDKNITIDGQKDSEINGEGTSESIFHLTSDASGATIQDVEITNGNNGIFAEGASDLTLRNLDINNIGINETIRNGPSNTGIVLSHADGLKLLNSKIHNIGRKAVGLEDTDGGLISGLSIEDVNLEAQHAQSHDAGGVKLFNTNDITVQDSYFSDINAVHIWNDTNNNVTIANNVIENVGEDFLAPAFNRHVDVFGIYDEKSANSVIKDNEVTAVDEFTAFRVTEFSGETLTLEDNDFSSQQLGTTDYWVNESAEKLIALTVDPDKADFSLIAEEYSAHANIGD